MLALTWLVYASFGVITGTIPPLVELIVQDLRMTYSQMGLVLGAWQLVYIGTAYPLGVLVDRLGVRRSLGLGIVVMLLSLVLRGLAGDFFTLFVAVALFGVGGPIISIGAPKVVSVWFQGNQRGLAAGVYATGPLIGMSFALATASSVVVPLVGTWRGVSLVYGVLVLLVLLAWWGFSRDIDVPHENQGSEFPDERDCSLEGHRSTSLNLLRISNVQIVLIFAVVTFLLNHGLNNWTPTLLREGGMTLMQAGYWTAAATTIGALGVLLIPNLARQGYRKWLLGALIAVSSLTTVGLASLSGLSLLSSLMASYIVRGPLMPVLTLVLMETRGIGAARIGAASGLFFTAAEIGGFGGPLLLGLSREWTGSLTMGVVVLGVLTAGLLLLLPLIRETRERVV